MDAQVLTNEEVNCHYRNEVGLGLCAFKNVVQRGSLPSSKLVLGNGVIWMH